MMQPIILAAGKGTRMGSDLPKTLCAVAGKPMLAYILEALASAQNCTSPIIVVGHKGDQIREFVGPSITCVEQSDLSGTGTATRVALPSIPQDATKVFILYGDHPFITPESIRAIEEAHDKAKATITLATATVKDFNDWRKVFVSFGRVMRDPSGEVEGIREYKNTNEIEQNILEINPGFYCVDKAWLTQALEQVERNAITNEFYLTDIVSLALDEEKKIETVSITAEEALGINSQGDAAQAESLLA
jgi:bifunctional UDP-N-acetylglucosamine pyrophosphorylase/glucosamine-1-phosphate N-acetyltransferase